MSLKTVYFLSNKGSSQMKNFFMFVCLLCLGLVSTNALAQISAGGTPPSFGNNFKQLSKSAQLLETIEVPEVDMQRVKQEDAKTVNSNRFAVAVPVKYNMESSGKWTTLKNKDRIWRLKLHAERALSLRTLFDRFWLPDGAKLFIYSEDRRQLLGAFTHINNKSSGRFATNIIKGNTMIIEYYEPHTVQQRGEVSIFRVDYGYHHVYSDTPSEIKEKSSVKVGFGGSGDCNKNVNCSLGNNWQDEKRGVVQLLVVNDKGSFFCSGSLINTTAQDGRPYILSANHCAGNGGLDLLDSWVFVFNYEASGCDNPSTEPSGEQSITGASLLSNNATSDFLLMEMSNRVPDSYNAYFNGWDRGSNTPSSTVSIHHPDGDIKKISIDEQSPTFTRYNSDDVNSDGTHLRVIWDQSTTTEGGSSGSPLFNNNGKIVGQLHGGKASCSNLSEPDWYGRVYKSWNGGGSKSTRLSDWLDPTGSGVTELDGRNSGGSNTGGDLAIKEAPSSVTKEAEKFYTIKVTYPKGGKAQIALKDRADNWKTYAWQEFDVNAGETTHSVKVFEEINSNNPDLVWEVKLNEGNDGSVIKPVTLSGGVSITDLAIQDAPSAIEKYADKFYDIKVAYPKGGKAQVSLKDRADNWKTYAWQEFDVNAGETTHSIKVFEEINSSNPDLVWEVKLNEGNDGNVIKVVNLAGGNITELTIRETPGSVFKNSGEKYTLKIAYPKGGKAQIALKDRADNWKSYAWKEFDVSTGETTHTVEVFENIDTDNADLVWEIKVNEGNDGYTIRAVTLSGWKSTKTLANTSLSIYPVPVAPESELTIELPKTEKVLKMEIVDANGQVVQEREVKEGEMTVQMPVLKRSNMYYLRVFTKFGVETYKIPVK